MFVPATAAEIPADKSPSEIKRMRAPAFLTSAISFLCRERSSTITVKSSISRPKRRAMFFRFSFTGASISTTPREDGDRVVRAKGAEVCAFERVDSDVDLRTRFGNLLADAKSAANFLSDVKHWGFIAFALTNHHASTHGNAVHYFPH